MKTTINAQIVAHSVNEQGDELISVLATFPRIILAEVNTHRMLSKNTSSSRAIPFNKMVETIKNDPFIPYAWQKDHSGMQGNDYITAPAEINYNIKDWLDARDYAIEQANKLNELGGVTKQLVNRLLEPFMWTTMLITGPKSGWDNFFKLRCGSYSIKGQEEEEGQILIFKSKKEIINYYGSKGYSMNKTYIGNDPITNEERFQGTIDEMSDLDWLKVNKGQAEIHMMALAESIYDARNESTPKLLQPGEWHIPFENKIVEILTHPESGNHSVGKEWTKDKVFVSTAMGARTSYTIVGEEKEINPEAMIGLHDRLLAQDPPHSSPLEHCAQAMSKEEHFHFTKTRPAFTEEEKNKGNEVVDFGWCSNLKGFIPYRYIIDNCLTL